MTATPLARPPRLCYSGVEGLGRLQSCSIGWARYRVEALIGEGAMADVYKAFDPGIHRTLAIKILKPEFRQNREYASRFLREAKAAGALNHPSIVTIYDVGQVDGYPYIAMELIDGRPLNEVVRERGKLQPPEKR